MGCSSANQAAINKAKSNDSSLFPEKFKIRFISYGTGIDYRQKAVLDSLISHHISACPIEYSKKSWGREGEVDYCFSGLDLDCEKIFYSDVSKNMVFKERVLLEKGAGCESNIERKGNRR